MFGVLTRVLRNCYLTYQFASDTQQGKCCGHCLIGVGVLVIPSDFSASGAWVDGVICYAVVAAVSYRMICRFIQCIMITQ